MAMEHGPRGVGAIVSFFYVNGLALECAGVRPGMLCTELNGKDITSLTFDEIGKLYSHDGERRMKFRMLSPQEIDQLATSEETAAARAIRNSREDWTSKSVREKEKVEARDRLARKIAKEKSLKNNGMFKLLIKKPTNKKKCEITHIVCFVKS